MAEPELKTITEREFGRELAGEQVGWVALTSAGYEGSPFVGAHLAMATVGDWGARVQCEAQITNDGGVRKTTAIPGLVKGFQAVASVSVIFDTEKPPHEQTRSMFMITDRVGGELNFSDMQALHLAGEPNIEFEELLRSREWAMSPKDLMAAMRARLVERGLERFYPSVYYTANLLLTHEAYMEGMADLPANKAVMPDPDMTETTKGQVELAAKITADLEAQIREDTKIRKDIKFMSSVSGQVPEEFVASRHRVAAAEAAVIESSNSLLAYEGVYLPVGISRSGPYMDATKTDEERAFGKQLSQLQRYMRGPVRNELGWEIGELEQRLKFTHQGLKALNLLATAEVA